MNNRINIIRRFGSKAGAAVAAVAAMVGASTASAAGELSTAITTELTEGKTEMLAVGAVVLGLTGVVLLIRKVRSSAG